MGVVTLDVNNPYKRIGGGSLDQELFKKTRQAPEIVTPTQPQQDQSSAPVKSPTPKKANASPDTGLPTNQQNSLPANQQTSETANQQTSNTPLSTKQKRKYSTYLRPDSILQIKIQSVQEGKKDHELLQDIVDWYYETHKR